VRTRMRVVPLYVYAQKGWDACPPAPLKELGHA